MDKSSVAITLDELERGVRNHLYSFFAFFLVRNADPLKRGSDEPKYPIHVRAAAAWDESQSDLIEYTWSYLGEHLRVVASVNAMRLEFDLRSVATNPLLEEYGPELLARAKGLCAKVILLEGKNPYEGDFHVNMPWPDSLRNGVEFSSNPDHNPRIGLHWHSRVDAYVQDDTLCFLFYQKPPQRMGFMKGSRWFSEPFRLKIGQVITFLSNRDGVGFPLGVLTVFAQVQAAQVACLD